MSRLDEEYDKGAHHELKLIGKALLGELYYQWYWECWCGDMSVRGYKTKMNCIKSHRRHHDYHLIYSDGT